MLLLEFIELSRLRLDDFEEGFHGWPPSFRVDVVGLHCCAIDIVGLNLRDKGHVAQRAFVSFLAIDDVTLVFFAQAVCVCLVDFLLGFLTIGRTFVGLAALLL